MPHELHRKCGRQASRLGDGQCHREQTARFDSPQGGSFRVRVKRWGKSPPRQRRRWRHEKPLPVQGKIGGWTARPIATGMPHPPALRASEATEGRSAARRALREMTAKSRASGWNIIRLTGPKTSLFRLGLAPAGSPLAGARSACARKRAAYCYDRGQRGTAKPLLSGPAYQSSTVMALRSAAELISCQSATRKGLLPPKSPRDSS